MKNLHRILAAFALLLSPLWGRAADPALPELPTIPERTFSVLDYGASPDGVTKNTSAIQKAIAAAAEAGGGTVLFPKGKYFTGAIHLQSNIALQIDEDATILFSSDPADYPLVRTRWECVEILNYSPPIYAYQCRNIAIRGKGTIDGNGPQWWARRRTGNQFSTAYAQLRKYANDDSKPESRVFGEKLPGLPPAFVQPYECQNVLLEGITVKDSPFWTIHLLYSQDITLRHLTMMGDGPNTDGVDPDSCNRVLIENCNFDNGDDCVAIKSGRDKDGRRVGRSCENITIRNCAMARGHGVSIGSETSGSIRHVLIENCALDGIDAGVRLKSTRGRGGVVEDITYRNLTMRNVQKEAVTITLRYEKGSGVIPAPKDESTPVFRNITVENITCESAKVGGAIFGLAEAPVENLTLKNVTINADSGFSATDVDGLHFEHVTISPKKGEKLILNNVKNFTVDGVKQD